MDSLMLSTDTIEQRSTLYYNKYRYRARLHLVGLNRTWYCKTILEYIERIEKTKKDTSRDVWVDRYRGGVNKELEQIEYDTIEKYINWRNTYFTPINKADKKVLIRIEHNVASVFSNDLALLRTLESISGHGSITYTEVDTCVPVGVKYFKNEPKHKYRAYLKTRYNMEEKFREDLIKFLDRYKNTETVIVPSLALSVWLSEVKNSWISRNCSSHFFIDYDDDSTTTLLGIMFGHMIGKRFKLEKQPDSI